MSHHRAHCSAAAPARSYMTAAAALGGTQAEADVFGVRVDKCLQEVNKSLKENEAKAAASSNAPLPA